MMMTIKMIRFGIFILFFFLSTKVESQVKDACLWSSAEFSFSPFKKGNILSGIGYRLNENLSQTERIYAEIGIQYKILKYLRIGIEYRYVEKNIHNERYYATRHRFTGELKIGYQIDRFGFDWACKYQIYKYDDIEHDWGNTKITHYNRNRFTISFLPKNSDIKPYVFSEIFIPLYPASIFFTDTQRTGAGVDFELNKKNTLKLMFFIETEQTNTNRYQNYITNIGYSFKL
jgi:hypothetical protein